jgi:GNAT superfamily N-acetyltransferase
MKPPVAARYTTKELSTKTWPDFERLFSQGGGWDFCWCMHFHRAKRSSEMQRLGTRAEKGARNRKEKKELVKSGRAHGILVYADGEPVGWCQYGPREELPRIDNSRKYRGLEPKNASQRLWRITCFVVHKKYRRRGVGSAALAAALGSIKRRGGGLVEAYPIKWWLPRTFGNESTHGTASMFEKAGFKAVAPFGKTRFSSHVLMRKTI